MDVKFPEIHVPLVGEDGNAFAILFRTKTALRKGGATPEEQKQYEEEATSGDYGHLLRTTMAWVNTDSDEDEDY